MPKVSVWLTSYNHGVVLKESIESVLNQTYQDYELIIVDDCSTDDSQEIIKKYAQNNDKIRPIFHEKNLGESKLSNAIDSLKGDYIAILHGDDKWDSRKLQFQVEVLDNCSEIAACFTGVNVIDSEGEILKNGHVYTEVFKFENRTRFEWLRYFWDNGNCLCHPSMLIRKDAYEKYSLFTTGLHSLPDFMQWIKLCFHADIYICPDKLTSFRVHDDGSNTSGDTEDKQKRLFVEEFLVYKQYFSFIKDKETLIKIFPESYEYVQNEEYILEFALAKTFFNGTKRSQKLLGINILYELFKNPLTEKRMAEIYGYTRKEFDKDKREFDIFGMISKEQYVVASMFIDTGKGFNESERIMSKVYIQGNGIVQISFDIKESIDVIRMLRFDLDEGKYRRCKIIKAIWGNGEKIELIPQNGIHKNDEDWFYTLDPQYYIKTIKDLKVLLTLKVDIISLQEVEQYFGNVRKELIELRKECSKSVGKKVIKKFQRICKKK